MGTTETRELFSDMLAEGLYMERRLTEVLPDLAGQASDSSLAEMFRHHLDETRELTGGGGPQGHDADRVAVTIHFLRPVLEELSVDHVDLPPEWEEWQLRWAAGETL